MSTDTSPEIGERWRQEIGRNIRRFHHLAALMVPGAEPRTGQTPRELVYRKRKACLYRYASPRAVRTPVLFVPNLGISRPYIFDLLPGASFIEHMTHEGFDFYLLDWGVFGPEDNTLTVEACVAEILPRMISKVLEVSATDEVSLVGYCMGAPLSSAFLASHEDTTVRNFVNMAGPIDFSRAGLFALWLEPRYFDVDHFVGALGAIPADLVRAGFKLLKPTMDLSAGLNLWWNLWNDRYVEGFRALTTWANEYVAFPGEFFRGWVRDFYQDNRLYREQLLIQGRRARLASITCPVLAIGATDDYLAPPACVRAIVEEVASPDKEYVELPGGHISLIAGRGAAVHCWPKVSGWLAARSA